MAAEEPNQYQVIISQDELDKLKRWGEWAKEKGFLDEFLVGLRTINFRLSREPAEWGEPRYHLKNLKLEMRFGTFSMFNVWYGVSSERPVVFVKVFQFRSDYRHGTPPETS